MDTYSLLPSFSFWIASLADIMTVLHCITILRNGLTLGQCYYIISIGLGKGLMGERLWDMSVKVIRRKLGGENNGNGHV